MSTETLTIIGYDQDDYCSHCGRKLMHCINTAELGIVGADCFVKMVAANRRRFSGNGKPTATIVRELARIRDRCKSAEAMRQLGRYPHHFVFEVAAVDTATIQRRRQTLALRAASPKRADPGRVVVDQQDVGHLPLFIAANEPRLL